MQSSPQNYLIYITVNHDNALDSTLFSPTLQVHVNKGT